MMATKDNVDVQPKMDIVRSKKVELIRVTDTGLDLPDDTFILRSSALEEILFNPFLVGRELRKASFRSSRAFWEMIAPMIAHYKLDQRVELVNLTGSLYYFLSGSHGKVFNDPIGQNFVGIKRFPIEGKFGEDGRQLFEAKVTYQSFEAVGKCGFLGDTIATSVSALGGISSWAPWAMKHGLKELYVFSICGSKIGAVRIHQLCKKLKLKVTFVFGLGLLGLGKDGTALMWKPDNDDHPITIPEYLKRGNQVFQPGDCAIGDWGLRFKNPRKHIREMRQARKGR